MALTSSKRMRTVTTMIAQAAACLVVGRVHLEAQHCSLPLLLRLSLPRPLPLKNPGRSRGLDIQNPEFSIWNQPFAAANRRMKSARNSTPSIGMAL